MKFSKLDSSSSIMVRDVWAPPFSELKPSFSRPVSFCIDGTYVDCMRTRRRWSPRDIVDFLFRIAIPVVLDVVKIPHPNSIRQTLRGHLASFTSWFDEYRMFPSAKIEQQREKDESLSVWMMATQRRGLRGSGQSDQISAEPAFRMVFYSPNHPTTFSA
jgi:hypothetical protein